MHPADRRILDDFTRTREVTIDLLRRIPDELLAKTPAGAEEPLAWEFWHIADGVAGWMGWCMGDGGATDLDPTEDRQIILSRLEETRDRLLDYFTRDDGRAMEARFQPTSPDFKDRVYDFTGRGRVLYLTQHEAHHRAKVMLAVRQMGFTDLPFVPYPHPLKQGGTADILAQRPDVVST